MSKQALSDFRDRLASDTGWQRELRERAGIGNDDGVPAGELVEFAAAKGFEFGIMDLQAADVGLSDEQLESVSGGAILVLSSASTSTMDKDHKGWSDLLSFGQMIHRPGGR